MSEYSVEDILKAKRVAREAGYEVSLPKDRVEQAKNVAAAYGYTVKPADTQPTQPTQNDIETALRTVTNAGYSVKKEFNNTPPQQAVPNNTPPQQAVPPTPVKPAAPEHEPSWAEKIAAKYL